MRYFYRIIVKVASVHILIRIFLLLPSGFPRIHYKIRIENYPKIRFSSFACFLPQMLWLPFTNSQFVRLFEIYVECFTFFVAKPEKSTVAEDYELQNSVSILNGSETKTLSSEATQILNSLPNLVVMEKQYIVFPIR